MGEDERVKRLAAANLMALEPYPGSQVPWRCRCLTCGAEVSPRLNDLRSQGGCRACGFKRSSEVQRRDADASATVMREHDFEPLEAYPGSNKPWRCRCLVCGTEGTPRLANVRLGQGCMTCGKRRMAEALALPAAVAEASMRAAGYEPLEPYPGSTARPWRARHLACGSEVAPHLGTIRAGFGGCLRCGYEKTGRARRLEDDRAVADMLAAGFEPLDPYPGGNRKPWRCRCLRCGMESTPTHGNVSRRGSGACRHCARYGFKVAEPAWVYLVERPADGVRQYGVTNEPEVRLGKHRAAGFTVVIELFACEDGHMALETEANLRAYLRLRGIGPACTRHELTAGGWTETFPALAAPDLRPSAMAPPF